MYDRWCVLAITNAISRTLLSGCDVWYSENDLSEVNVVVVPILPNQPLLYVHIDSDKRYTCFNCWVVTFGKHKTYHRDRPHSIHKLTQSKHQQIVCTSRRTNINMQETTDTPCSGIWHRPAFTQVVSENPCFDTVRLSHRSLVKIHALTSKERQCIQLQCN